MTQTAYFRIFIFACDSDHAYLAQKWTFLAINFADWTIVKVKL